MIKVNSLSEESPVCPMIESAVWFLIFFSLNVYLWLHWVFIAAWAFSSCDAWASHCGGFSLQSMASRVCELQ